MSKRKIHSAVMKKNDMTYLLWTSENKSTFSTHANYFSSRSGMNYDGKGEFYRDKYSMKQVISKTYDEALEVLTSKVREKLDTGYVVVEMKAIDIEGVA